MMGGGSYLGNAGTFLIQVIFGFFMLMFMLRFLLQLVRADFFNPLSQFLVKVTNPVLRPMRRLVPGLFGIDMASVIVLLLLQMLEIWLMIWMTGGSIQAPGLVVYSLAQLLDLVIKIFTVTILIQVVLSWVNPGAYNPVSALLWQLNEPLLAPARRILPAISGIDLSPLVVVVVLQLIDILLVAPLADIGRSLA